MDVERSSVHVVSKRQARTENPVHRAIFAEKMLKVGGRLELRDRRAANVF